MSEGEPSGYPDSIFMLRKDHTNLAASVSQLTQAVAEVKTAVAEVKTADAVDAERRENLNQRLDRIEASIKGLYGIGKWLLAAFFGALIAAAVTFIVNGGLNAPPTP